MRPRCSVVALVLCALIVGLHADIVTYQQLDPTGHCAPKTSAICNGVAGLSFGTSIWLNASTPEQSIVDALTPYYQQVQLLSVVGYTECHNQIEIYLCLSAFPLCENYTINSTVISLPRVPCHNVCDVTLNICATAFATYGQTFPPCPTNDTVYDFSSVGGTIFPANCIESAGLQNTGECIPAHEALMGVHQSDVLRICYIVFGWIGFVGNIAVLLLYAFHSQFTQWPNPIIIFMSASQAILAFGLILGTFVGRRDLVCVPTANLARLCKFQSILIIFGLLFTLAFWFMMTVSTFIIVIQSNPRKLLRWLSKRWYYIMGYLIVPLLFTCLMLPSIGAETAFLFCVANGIKPVERYIIWPICGEMVIGTLCWLATLVVLAKTFSATDWRRDIVLYARMLIYEIIALFPACMLTLPIELLRRRVYNGDVSLLTDGSGKRAAQGLTIGCFLTPVIFALVFLVKREHAKYVKEKVKSFRSTASTSKSRSAAEEGEEISKF